MSSDLGVKALDEEVNQLLQEMQDVPLPTPAPATNHLESGTSTWYKGTIHSVEGRRSVYRQIYEEWNETESGSLEINTYWISDHVYLVLTS